MRVFDKLLTKFRSQQLEVSSTAWTVLQNGVHRELRYSRLGGNHQVAVSVRMKCHYNQREPILLLTLHFLPKLASDEGYGAARCWSRAGETPFVVVKLIQHSEETEIQFIEGTKEMLQRFLDGESLTLWLGGPGGELVEMPIPSAELTSDMMDQAWGWAARWAQDLSEL